MIEPLLRDCIDVDGVARLFAALGYPVRPVAVAPEALGVLGVRSGGPSIHHLCRNGGIDLYVSRTEEPADREWLNELSDRLAERNHVSRPVIVELGARSTLSIHLRSARRRHRLDIDVNAPSPDSIDRMCGLMIRGRGENGADPATLFERALDRESMGRRFFEQFRRSVATVAEELESQFPRESTEACRDQALLLLSRMLFVYLIQRKGWLDGDHRFLRERLATCMRRGSSFHISVIGPLFFDCLNRPHRRRPAGARRLGRIPYLNGGLFEPSQFERRCGPIELSNELWREILDSSFEPFTLSVSELDEEGAHVDPEMLGKVFEKLMESEERARTGTFYTPRAVADCLARVAIVRWCARGDETLAAKLFRVFASEELHVDGETAKMLLRRLESITVLDPACGTGAFLLAALRGIESLTRALAEAAGECVPSDLRARIAARSIYGVDLKPEAVRLCELRIWLAIVSSADLAIESVPPLPNLDRNVMQGNSLVDPLDFLSGERTGIYRDWIRGLREREELLDAYRRSSSGRRRKLAKRLRDSDRDLAAELLKRSVDLAEAEVRELESLEGGLFDGAPKLSGKVRREGDDRLRTRREMLDRLEHEEVGFFAYDLHFATVTARGGFAVVLGNPPWVRGSMLDADVRKTLASRYESFAPGRSAGFRQTELSMAFVERSVALAAADGVVAQLLPCKVTSADYAAAVRRALVTEVAVVELHDWSTVGRELFGADVFPLGVVASKAKSDREVEVHVDGRSYRIAREKLSVSGAGSGWSTLPPDVGAILRRIRDRHRPLSDVLGRPPVMGVKTGANRTFFLDRVEIDEGGVFIPSLGLTLPPGGVVRTARGRDVRRWRAVDSTWMLWPSGINGDRELGAQIADRLGIARTELKLSYVKSEHLGIKLVWKDVSRGLSAAVLSDRTRIEGLWFAVVPNQTLYSIDVATRDEGHALAAVLNSTVANALALETAERAKDHHWRYMGNVIGALAVPDISAADEEWRSLSRLGRRAESGEQVERRLNRLVADLYGIDGYELERLESFVADRLGRADDAGS